MLTTATLITVPAIQNHVVKDMTPLIVAAVVLVLLVVMLTTHAQEGEPIVVMIVIPTIRVVEVATTIASKAAVIRQGLAEVLPVAMANQAGLTIRNAQAATTAGTPTHRKEAAVEAAGIVVAAITIAGTITTAAADVVAGVVAAAVVAVATAVAQAQEAVARRVALVTNIISDYSVNQTEK